jgi:hypothetical protein
MIQHEDIMSPNLLKIDPETKDMLQNFTMA